MEIYSAVVPPTGLPPWKQVVGGSRIGYRIIAVLPFVIRDHSLWFV